MQTDVADSSCADVNTKTSEKQQLSNTAATQYTGVQSVKIQQGT